MTNKLENLVDGAVGFAFATGGSMMVFGYELAKGNYALGVVFGGAAILSAAGTIYYMNKIEKK